MSTSIKLSASTTASTKNIDPKIRDWFKSVRSKNGIPFAVISLTAQNHMRGTSEGGYEVPIAGEWKKSPFEAIVYNAGNPRERRSCGMLKQGENTYHIRCFVPGGGV